jgi:hypothetical protein
MVQWCSAISSSSRGSTFLREPREPGRWQQALLLGGLCSRCLHECNFYVPLLLRAKKIWFCIATANNTVCGQGTHGKSPRAERARWVDTKYNEELG